MRPDSFQEWLASLAVGDEVLIQYIWVEGKPTCRAWVEHVGDASITIHWMTFDDAEHGIGKNKARFTLPGGGNTHVRIHHPTRPTEYDARLGYEFADRIEFFIAEKMQGNPL